MELSCDVLIVGGGTGGVAAALSSCDAMAQVIICEESDWLGGQLTSQMVPPDENQWIETQGANYSYRAFREKIRDYYRRKSILKPEVMSGENFNPGGGSVSGLCFEPEIGVEVINEMLAPHVVQGRLKILLNTKLTAVENNGDKLSAAEFCNAQQEKITITAKVFIDGTELGDLIKLGGVEYVSGAESQAQTQEPHALPGAPEVDNVQAFTWCLALGCDRNRLGHLIAKPENYEFWHNLIPQLQPNWSGKLLSFTYSRPTDLTAVSSYLKCVTTASDGIYSGYDFWRYRQVRSAANYAAATDEFSIMNWPQNDYMLGNIIDKSPEEMQKHYAAAQELSLSMLYYLQTEAPRPDGGYGFPELYAAPAISCTASGLAKMPYIRESRRLQALFTVTELHVGEAVRREFSRQAAEFIDSVGIGYYRIDLHPSSNGRNYIDIGSLPFQIPFRALVPKRCENLLAAGKNIGTTHITNGCYRLHPVEWSIGEAAGAAAGLAVSRNILPRLIGEDFNWLGELQQILIQRGVRLAWNINV